MWVCVWGWAYVSIIIIVASAMVYSVVPLSVLSCIECSLPSSLLDTASTSVSFFSSSILVVVGNVIDSFGWTGCLRPLITTGALCIEERVRVWMCEGVSVWYDTCRLNDEDGLVNTPKGIVPGRGVVTEGCRKGATRVVDTLCGTSGGGLAPKVKGWSSGMLGVTWEALMVGSTPPRPSGTPDNSRPIWN